MTGPRRFGLLRDRPDGTTERVADGVAWPDGAVTVRRRTARAATATWDAPTARTPLDAFVTRGEVTEGLGVAGTRLVWDDADPADRATSAALLLDDLPTLVRAARRRRGTSLRAAAAATGTSAASLQRLERGRDCTYRTAAALLRWLAPRPTEPPPPTGRRPAT